MKYYMEQLFRVYDEDSNYWEISEDPDGLQNIEFKYVNSYEDEDGLNKHEKSISVPIEIIDYLIIAMKNIKLKIEQVSK
jgi:hypothetical protein